MSFQLKIEIFEGPLDLLLYLIREKKMDICDIPIVEITRQYMAYLEVLKELNLELAGEYLVMAAELMRIKTRSLLPKPPEDEEKEEGQDPRDELTRRLLEYQRYKNASFDLRLKEHQRQQLFGRGAEIVHHVEGEEALVDANVFDLFTAFKKILDEKKDTPDYEVEITHLSVTDRIHYLLELLNATDSVTFESLFTPLNTKQEIIVTFLGLLELMRLKLARIQQVGSFETIRVYRVADKETQAEVLRDYMEPGEVQNPLEEAP